MKKVCTFTLLHNGICKNLTSYLPRPFGQRSVGIFRALYGLLAEAMARTLAPLRRIVARELEVYEYDRIHTDRPQSFAIHSTLECGHIKTSLTWDLFDLLDPYTENPEVSARHHRCRPCASLLAKKPVQAVGLASKAGAA